MTRKVRGLRWYIVGLLCVASELNYFDRQTLSVLAQTIQDDLHITTIEYARITSWFLVSYTIMYAVSGVLVDRLGARRAFLIFVTGWSAANLLHAFARTAAHFSAFRFLLGATEPANFPAGVKAVAEWFPMRERALAIGIFNGGTAVGAAFAAPVASWIALTWGWRYAFVFGAGLGFVWVAVWAVVYRRPQDHPWLRVNERHLSFAETTENASAALPIRLGQLLRTREVWGCIVARMLTDPISYFFIFWMPKFLQQERGFSLAEIGKYSGIPFLALALGNLASGGVPALLAAWGWSLNRARKSVMCAASLLMPVCCLSVTQVASPALAVALMSLAMFLHAAWGTIALPTEVLPQSVVGTVTGIAGALGGVTGIITQQAVGWTVQHVSFTPVFVACAFVHLTTFVVVCATIREIGKIRPMV